MPEQNAADIIQEIIDKQKRPFMTVKNLTLSMGAKLRRELGIESCKSNAEIRHVLEQQIGDRFIFHKKGQVLYILVPCDPVDLVKAELSTDHPKGTVGIAKVLPFSRADVSEILNHLLDTGEAKLILNELLDTRIIATGHKADKHDPDSYSEACSDSGDYSHNQDDFIDAIKELDRGNYFVKIPALRKRLGWPREKFDGMLRFLRDREIIQMHVADDTAMTPDEVSNCFIDENNYRMGTVTLNVR